MGHDVSLFSFPEEFQMFDEEIKINCLKGDFTMDKFEDFDVLYGYSSATGVQTEIQNQHRAFWLGAGVCC